MYMKTIFGLQARCRYHRSLTGNLLIIPLSKSLKLLTEELDPEILLLQSFGGSPLT